MRLLRIIRGVLGTALSFAVPWAIFGTALSAAVEAVWPGAGTQGPLPEFYFWVAQSGPIVFGALGGAGGFAVGAAIFGAAGAYFHIWPTQYSIGVGIAALLGAGSAATLLAWARRSSAREELPAASARDRVTDKGERQPRE